MNGIGWWKRSCEGMWDIFNWHECHCLWHCNGTGARRITDAAIYRCVREVSGTLVMGLLSWGVTWFWTKDQCACPSSHWVTIPEYCFGNGVRAIMFWIWDTIHIILQALGRLQHIYRTYKCPPPMSGSFKEMVINVAFGLTFTRKYVNSLLVHRSKTHFCRMVETKRADINLYIQVNGPVMCRPSILQFFMALWRFLHGVDLALFLLPSRLTWKTHTLPRIMTN